MPVVSTDDAARGLKFLYLGPPGKRWPAATIPAYATFFLMALTGIVVGFLTRPNFGVWFLIETPLSIGLSLLVTRFAFKYIDGDVTVRYQINTFKAEIRAPRPEARRQTYVTTIPASLFHDHRETR